MNIHFESHIAEVVGVDAAIMLTNLEFWIKKNEANKKHFHDGYYWTYNTQEAYTKLFPFWSRRQIQRILSNLINGGYLITGNYNEKPYDKTTWYALSEKAWLLIAPNGAKECTKQCKGMPQTVQPIPYSNTDANTNIYSYWNSKGIIVHKSLTKTIEKAIGKALKEYSEEDILKAIDTYKEILDSDYFFEYKWTLAEFLTREKGISTFTDEGSNKANYEAWKNKTTSKGKMKVEDMF